MRSKQKKKLQRKFKNAQLHSVRNISQNSLQSVFVALFYRLCTLKFGKPANKQNVTKLQINALFCTSCEDSSKQKRIKNRSVTYLLQHIVVHFHTLFCFSPTSHRKNPIAKNLLQGALRRERTLLTNGLQLKTKCIQLISTMNNQFLLVPIYLQVYSHDNLSFKFITRQ